MNRVLRQKKGFSLVELAIVMVIIGLIMGAGVTIWKSTIDSTRLSSTKTNLDNIKNAVINFAMANGRLPCPDTTLPPNNTGQSNPTGLGICAGCAAPPCYVPYQTLQINLPGGRDSFGNVFRYDVCYDTAGGSRGLSNTTQDTFCGVLFEYMSHATDVAPPAPVPTPVPIVTNRNDANDDGLIAALAGVPQGYGVAAVIISQSSVGNVFDAPTGLNAKNSAGTPREYEIASRQNDSNYGNLVAELTFGELFNKVCTAQKTKIRIQNYTGSPKWAKITGTTLCSQINQAIAGVCATPPCHIDIYQGSSVDFYNTLNDCQGFCATPPCPPVVLCGSTITFNMLPTPSNDAGTTDWGVAGIYGRDGKVRIILPGCTLDQNTYPIP